MISPILASVICYIDLVKLIIDLHSVLMITIVNQVMHARLRNSYIWLLVSVRTKYSRIYTEPRRSACSHWLVKCF